MQLGRRVMAVATAAAMATGAVWAAQGRTLSDRDYPVRAMIQEVVKSDLFRSN